MHIYKHSIPNVSSHVGLLQESVNFSYFNPSFLNIKPTLPTLPPSSDSEPCELHNDLTNAGEVQKATSTCCKAAGIRKGIQM